jgi:hypothetical protein
MTHYIRIHFLDKPVVGVWFFGKKSESSARNVLEHCHSVIFLKMKSVKSTKHYLTEMLLANN